MTGKPWKGIATLFLCAAIGSACADDRTGQISSTETDSAGVRLVTNRLVGPPPAVPQVVADSPTFVIAESDIDPRYEFGEFIGVRRLPDGTIAVADNNPIALRLYDSTGVWLGDLYPGEPRPGEIEELIFFSSFADTLVLCCRNGLMYLTTDGRVAATTDTVTGVLSALLSNGSWIVRGEESALGMFTGRKEVTLRTTQDTFYVVSRSDTARRSIGTFERAEQLYIFDPDPNPLGSSVNHVAAPFFAASRLRVAPNGFLYTDGRTMSAAMYDNDGRKHLSFSLNIEPQATSRTLFRDYRERVLRFYNDPVQDSYMRWVLDNMPQPRTLPAVEDVFVGDDGRIWMRQRLIPIGALTDWHIFAPDGRYTGALSVPSEWYIQQAGSDYIIFVKRRTDGGVTLEHRRLLDAHAPVSGVDDPDREGP